MREVEVGRDLDLRLLEGLDRAEDADERRVLLQADEVVQERRDHAAHGLREHDRGERLAAGEPERARGRFLARVHRLDPGAVHLGDVGGVDEDEREDPPERRRRRDPLDRERRRAEAEQCDHEDRRHAAEEVGVGDREHADREEDGAGEAAQDGERERGDEDDRLRDAEDLHVQQEGAGDRPGTSSCRRPSRRRPPSPRASSARG